jgi:hypothetical protein
MPNKIRHCIIHNVSTLMMSKHLGWKQIEAQFSFMSKNN